MPSPFRYLLRAKRLAQNPPAMWRVKLGLGVIAVCIALFALERWVGTPDWMKPERTNRPNITTLQP